MRKIIIAIAILSAFSCSKKKYCWECRTTAVIESGNVEVSREQTTNDMCDMSVEGKRKFETDNTRKIEKQMGSSAKVFTNCTLKND
ncbi:MAG: hypothetical protein QM802_20005 [Agriterribacter sp.]